MRECKKIEKVEIHKTITAKCDICGITAHHAISGNTVIDWELDSGVDVSTAIWMEDGESNYYSAEFCPKCFKEILGKYLKRVE
jgi:hypothetical protein